MNVQVYSNSCKSEDESAINNEYFHENYALLGASSKFESTFKNVFENIHTKFKNEKPKCNQKGFVFEIKYTISEGHLLTWLNKIWLKLIFRGLLEKKLSMIGPNRPSPADQ